MTGVLVFALAATGLSWCLSKFLSDVSDGDFPTQRWWPDALDASLRGAARWLVTNPPLTCPICSATWGVIGLAVIAGRSWTPENVVKGFAAIAVSVAAAKAADHVFGG